jgi:hypothetical protein
MENTFNLKKFLAEGKMLKEEITIPTLDENSWKLWLQLSNEAGIEDYDLETYNYKQINGILKEISWVASNKDKYSNYEELFNAYNDFLDDTYDVPYEQM